jgi:hypothetical protein
MDCSEAGRKGGKSRSEAKRAQSALNLALARQARRAMSDSDAPTDEPTRMKWIADGELILKHLETTRAVVLKASA